MPEPKKTTFTIDSIEPYLVYRGELATDGYLGIPVGISTYIKDKEAANTKTPLIFYVVNTMTKRVGTASDEEILTDFLERGYLVCVLDYYSDPRAAVPKLEWSIQNIKYNFATREEFKQKQLAGIPFSPLFIYNLPAGYSLTRQLNFWSIDRHGVDGSFDFIISVWNNDFVSTKGNKVITFPDGRQMSVKEYTESLPGGKVTDISQCIRPDGSHISFDLFMDVIYPTSPKSKVPVLVYASSSQDTVGTWRNPQRPHVTGFLERGYAVVLYDYPYIPMARNDHYGYFDGDAFPGHKTGDNYTYSIGKPNDTLSSTAAQRFVRHLADTEGDTYRFDTDHIGIMGISKTGNTHRMAHPDPTTLYEPRYFADHHGETRYENGDVSDRYDENGRLLVRGGEVQPWLYDSEGKPISSHAHFASTAVGSAQESINSDFSPIFCPGTMLKGGSYFSYWPEVASRCYTADVPYLGYVCTDIGHSFAFGTDRDHGVDTFAALFDMADYNLRGASAKCEYTVPKNGCSNWATTDKIQLRFNAPIPRAEIERVSIISLAGEKLSGEWISSWRGTLWELVPFGMKGSESYTLIVPEDLKSDNGRQIAAGVVVNFSTRKEKATHTPVENITLRYGTPLDITLAVPNGKYSSCKLRFGVSEPSSNAVSVKVGDQLLGVAYITGVGEYEVDVTEYVKALEKNEGTFTLSVQKASGTRTVAKLDPTETSPERLQVKAKHRITDELGRSALKIGEIDPETKFMPYHAYYAGANTVAIFHPLGALKPEDLGRRFTVKLELYDTVSRQAGINIGYTSHNGEIDLKAVRTNHRTCAGEWQTLSVDYRIEDPRHIDILDRGQIALFVEQHGAASGEKPLYLGSLELIETVTDVEITSPRLVWM